VLDWLDPLRTEHVYWAGRLTFCANRDDIARYDAVFGTWLAGRPRPIPIRLPALTRSARGAVRGLDTGQSTRPMAARRCRPARATSSCCGIVTWPS
jgi:hypothetical protein